MASNLTQIQCPRCRVPIQARLDQVVDASRDPASKARLLSGTLNHVHCKACGFDGQIAGPLVYHDSEKELLLTYVPVELGMNQAEQERTLGKLINLVVNQLPPEARKGYLLQPKQVLSMQSLVEQVLDADGVTREEIEAQRARIQLFEQLLRTPEEGLMAFVTQHDAEMDEVFFQLASLSLEATPDQRAREAAASRLETALALSSVGKKILEQEAAMRTAAESLRQAGETLTREKLLELIIQAPDHNRVVALVRLTRPALDYTFFQTLTERVDAAQGQEKERLNAVREQVLDTTQEIDRLQEARLAQAGELLRSLVQAQNLDEAIPSVLPLIDDLFLATLRANLTAAKERGDLPTHERLEEISKRLNAAIEASLPPDVRLAQRAIQMELEQAKALLESEAALVDERVVSLLLSASQTLGERQQPEAAKRVREIYRLALRISMRRKMQAQEESASK